MLTRRVRLWLSLVALLQLSLLFGLAWARFANVHQRTFDLALYVRVAWGWAHGDLWSPILNTHALGAHVSPVLIPLGLLGRLLGTVPVLLFAQALCISLCVFPLARIGARRLGTRGVWLATAAFVLYPNLFHVGSYEFHPGTLAVLPMCWAYDALDRAKLRQLALAAFAILMCRADLGLFALLLTLVYYRTHRDRRALHLLYGCAAYTALAVTITLAHAPEVSSLDQHFAPWGGSPFGVVRVLFSDPARVFEHFGARERLMYIPRLLAPLSFFSLRAPHLLLPAVPYVALNLVSAFPTADEQYSHYLTPVVPALIVSGIVGVTALRARFLRALWFVTLGIAHFALGGSPLSRDFEREAFFPDAATSAARRVLALIPDEASVQAPDPLLPHLAERHDVRRAPPPEAATEFVVLDIRHRETFARREVLLRTTEEPLVRTLSARPDHALLAYAPPYALFARGRDARSAAVAQSCFTRVPESEAESRLTDCLGLSHATLVDQTLTLFMRARTACPADLALRFGPDPMPGRVELLCDGKLSPALLQPGDGVRSVHRLSPRGAREVRERGLWVGTLRSSGAPPRAADPAAIRVPLQSEDI